MKNKESFNKALDWLNGAYLANALTKNDYKQCLENIVKTYKIEETILIDLPYDFED